MDETFDDEAEVGADWADLIGSQIASIGEDWDVVTSMLPALWQARRWSWVRCGGSADLPAWRRCFACC
jgi:hypothetical protein